MFGLGIFEILVFILIGAVGAALLTWVLFRLPRMWNGVRTKFVSH